MDFQLMVVEDNKPLNNPNLRRFSLVFTSEDGDVVVRGCLLAGGKEVLGPSVMLGRRPYDIVTLSPTIKQTLQREFYMQDNFPDRRLRRLKEMGFGLKEFKDGG
jgi:hypothetical protein